MVLKGTQKATLQWMSGKRQSKEISNGQVLCVYPNTLFSMSQTTTSSLLKEVDKTMQARKQAIAMLQFHLKRSQNRIKSMADKHRSNRNFEAKKQAIAMLQFHLKRQSTVRQGTHHKVAAKYYGPFVVIAKVEKVGVLPFCGPDGVLSVEPEAIIGRRLGKLNNKAVLYVLVKWVNQTEEEATWELYTDLLQRYPHIELHS
nr:reverse transcriptase [Tanacetum cinerariifolium]